MSLAVVVAPFDGVVARRLVEPGAVVAPSTPILTLALPGPLKIDVSVPERDADLARAGMAARLDLETYPGRVFDGKVARLISSPDSSGGALVAEVHVANPERLLKPGMAARVSVALGGKPDAVLVPSAAVVEEEERGAVKKFVFTVADGKAKKIAVTTGRTENGRTEIAHGLAAGEKVVVSGHQRLSPEMRVRIVEEKPR